MNELMSTEIMESDRWSASERIYQPPLTWQHRLALVLFATAIAIAAWWSVL